MMALRLLPLMVCSCLACNLAAQTPPPTEYKLGDQGWKPVESPAPGSDADLIARARRELAEDRPEVAESILDDFIDRNEKSSNGFLPQAYLYRGDTISAGGNEFKALYDYEFVITSFPQSPEYALAIERELEIAVRYLAGLRRKLLGIRFVGATDIGEELLIRVQERLPGGRLAERAGIELADHYYRVRDMELASEAYDLFLQNHPNSQYRMKAMQRRVYASIARYKGPRYDSRPLVDSEVLIRQFALQYPAEAEKSGIDDALLTRIDESGALQLLEIARGYFRRGDPAAARYTLKRLLASHPLTSAAQTAIDICQERGWLASPSQPPASSTPPSAAAPPPSVPAPVVPPSTPTPETKP